MKNKYMYFSIFYSKRSLLFFSVIMIISNLHFKNCLGANSNPNYNGEINLEEKKVSGNNFNINNFSIETQKSNEQINSLYKDKSNEIESLEHQFLYHNMNINSSSSELDTENTKEETINLISIKSDSTFTKQDQDGNILLNLGAKNLLFEGIWCSAGNHGINDEVKLSLELENTKLLSSISINWAYAPGEFRIRYSINKRHWKDIFKQGFRLIDKQTDIKNFKKLIKDQTYINRLKTLKEKIILDEIDFVRYLEIIMRIPINKYFGIQKLEFYQLVQTIVTLKSMTKGEDLCLTVSDNEFQPNSYLLSMNCINAISFGDNREIFIINTNGYITPYSMPNMCIQSDSYAVTLIECVVAEEYRDNRHKWIMEPDGLIRSKKDLSKCLNIEESSNSFGSRLTPEHMIVSASSTQADNQYTADRAIDYNNSGSYWASEPTDSVNDVEYKIEFKHSLSFPIHIVQINWKFPAKKYEIIGFLFDNNHKVFERVEANRRTFTEHSLKGYEFKGIIIKMKESSMKVENKNIFGILNIYIFTDGKLIKTDKCNKSILNSNKWKIILTSNYDRESGLEYRKNLTIMNRKIEQMKTIQNSFEILPSEFSSISDNDAEVNSLFKKIDDIISEFKSNLIPFTKFINLDETPSSKNSVGDSLYTPATDCAEIKISFPEKRSGFYWIKNECMDNPLRVFCDFNQKSKTALDYLVLDISDKVVQNNFKLNDKFPKDKNEYILTIRKKCGEFGLEPLEIKDVHILNRLFYLIKINQFKFGYQNDYIFPIGINYDSDFSNNSSTRRSSLIKKANGNFSSLNSMDSPEILEMLKQIDASDNLDKFKIVKEMMDTYLDELEVDIKTQNYDSNNVIGISTNEKIILSKIQYHKIIGFACSSNNSESFDKNNSMNIYDNTSAASKREREIKCETTLSVLINNTRRNSENPPNNFLIFCPKDCAEKIFPVYGSEIFTDHSSICRAGIHSGLIKNIYGGYLSVNVVDGKDFYEGNVSNEVESKEYNKRCERSFRLEKYEFDCPLPKVEMDIKNYFKNYKASIYYSQNISINSKNTKFTSFISLAENTSISTNKVKLGNNNFVFFRNWNTSSLNLDENSENKTHFLSNNQNNPTIKLTNIQDIINASSLISSFRPENSLTTEKALIQIHFINGKIEKEIKQTNQMVNAFKYFLSKLKDHLYYLRSDINRGVESRYKKFKSYAKQIEEIDKLIINLETVFTQNINKSEDDLYDLRDEISEMMRWENFQEDYTNEALSSNYQIFNNKKFQAPQNPPAKWEYYVYNLNGRNKVIRQTNPFYDTMTGSHLIVKGREFYDFELKLSVFIPKNNLDTFGVAFRYVDHFTYYVFEVSKRENGFKRIRKFVNGEPVIIKTKYDGGYNVEEWMDIKIRAVNSNFTIYTKSHELASDYEIIFEFNDNSIVHGTVAFTSLMLINLMLDDISVIQIACTDYSSVNKVLDIRRIESKK